MYDLSVSKLLIITGVVFILFGIAHWVVLILRRKCPVRCTEEVYATCVRVDEVQGLSLLAADSTRPLYSCVFQFEYSGTTVLVKQKEDWHKPQYAVGETVKLYVNPSDLTDFWYRRKRFGLYLSIMGTLLIVLGVGILVLVYLFKDFSLFNYLSDLL